MSKQEILAQIRCVWLIVSAIFVEKSSLSLTDCIPDDNIGITAGAGHEVAAVNNVDTETVVVLQQRLATFGTVITIVFTYIIIN